MVPRRCAGLIFDARSAFDDSRTGVHSLGGKIRDTVAQDANANVAPVLSSLPATGDTTGATQLPDDLRGRT